MLTVTLFLVSLVCLGSWLIAFKQAGRHARFELFAIDIAFGALLFSFLAAFTLGNTIADLSFSDQLLLSSKTSQALVVSAGIVFGIATLLVLGAVSLLGMAGAVLLCVATGFIVNASIDYRSYQLTLLLAGFALLASGMLIDIWACRSRSSGEMLAGKPLSGSPGAGRLRHRKGLIVSLVAGAALGASYPLAEGGLYGDLGVGPYGGLLFFSLGSLVSTLLLSVFSFNIALEGNRLNLGAYFAKPLRRHLFGLAGGAVWAAGALATFLAKTATAEAASKQTLLSLLPVASTLLAMAWGVLVYREFASAPPKSKLFLAVAAALLVCGFWLIHSAHSV